MSTPSKRCPLPSVPVEVDAKLLTELFVSVWNSCGSSDEAAKRLGMSHDVVVEWVRHYRTTGLTLHDLPREQDRVKYFIQQMLRRSAQRNRGRARRSCGDQKWSS